MSSEASGYVFKHSPYKGAALSLHLAIADSVNDIHNYEVWLTNSKLAAKARLTRETTNRLIQGLVNAGLLTRLSPEDHGRKPVRYRFEMPDLPVVFDPRSHVTTDHKPSDLRSLPHVISDHTGTQDRTQGEPKQDGVRASGLFVIDDPSFEQFWKIYPKRMGKQAAHKLWDKVTKTKQATGAQLCSGAELLRDFVAAGHREMRFVPYPATWLNDGGWDDELIVPVPAVRAATGRQSEPKGFAGLREWAETGDFT